MKVATFCCLIVIAVAAPSSAQPTSAPATQAAWNRAETHEFAIATPAGFDRKPQSSPTMVLHVGRELTDETGQPMRLGLTIERIPDRSTEDPRAAAEQLVLRFKDDAGFKLIGEPVLETTRLTDGTIAALLRVEAHRGAERRTAIGKLIATDGRVRWIASVFVTAGRSSSLAGCDSTAYRSLEPYLRTFTLHPQEFSAAPLEPALPSTAPVELPSTAPVETPSTAPVEAASTAPSTQPD